MSDLKPDVEAEEPKVISVNLTEAEQQSAIATTVVGEISEVGTKLTIRSEKNLQKSSELLLKIKKTSKDVETQKKKYLDPIKAAKKTVEDFFKPAEDELKNVEKVIKEAVRVYHQKSDEKAAKQAEAVESKVDSGELELAEGMSQISTIKQATSSVKGLGGGSVSVRLGARRIRITDASKLPARFFMRERVIEALRLEVSQDVLKEGAECPEGAEVYQEKLVAARTS